MNDFIAELKSRNKLLYFFGFECLLAAAICVYLIFSTDTEVLGINAWIKPFKFFLSTTIFCWSMAWYMDLLKEPRSVKVYSWVVVIVLGFEIIYIAYQASQGQLSHFNVSSEFHGMMFGLMGIAISIMTLWTLFMGIRFFGPRVRHTNRAYLWGIRLGIILFVIFAFEGGMMAQRLAHTVGAPDGGPGLPLLNWSTENGDLRAAHFVGMHALQIIPLAGYFLKKLSIVFVISGIYFLLALFLLFQALGGTPFLSI